MESKKWYQSKGIVAGLLAIAVQVYAFVQANFAPGLPIPPEGAVDSIMAILIGIGIFGRVTATSTIK